MAQNLGERVSDASRLGDLRRKVYFWEKMERSRRGDSSGIWSPLLLEPCACISCFMTGRVQLGIVAGLAGG